RPALECRPSRKGRSGWPTIPDGVNEAVTARHALAGNRHLDDDLVLDGAPPRTLVSHPASDREGRHFVQVLFLQYLVLGRRREPSRPCEPRPSLSVRSTPWPGPFGSLPRIQRM